MFGVLQHNEYQNRISRAKATANNVATATMDTTATGNGTTITGLTFKGTASGDAQNEVEIGRASCRERV